MADDPRPDDDATRIYRPYGSPPPDDGTDPLAPPPDALPAEEDAPDPFAPGAGPADDPFAPEPSGTPDPFSATPTPAPDPFGPPDAAPPADPFAASPSSDPFAALETADPFAPASVSPADDPFAPADDPFAPAPSAATDPPTPDPFVPPPGPDPFAPAPEAAAPDPFAPSPADDPFAPASDTAAPDPFAPAPSATTPSDPFAPAAGPSDADPFRAPAGAPDPFTPPPGPDPFAPRSEAKPPPPPAPPPAPAPDPYRAGPADPFAPAPAASGPAPPERSDPFAPAGPLAAGADPFAEFQGPGLGGPASFDSGLREMPHEHDAMLLPSAFGAERTLAGAFTPVFTLILQLRDAVGLGDPTELRRRIETLLREAAARAREGGAADADVEEATICVVAFLDEAVLGADWAGRDAWSSEPLQLTHYDRNDLGERFFDRLKQLLDEGATRREVLEVYYLCLALGFKGRYAIHGREVLRRLVTDLHGRLAAGAPAGDLSPRGRSREVPAEAEKGGLPTWALWAGAAGLVLLLYLGLSFSLSAAAGDAADALRALTSS